jgi:hypothetical protein
MNVIVNQVSFARETNQRYYPIWRIDFQVNGERRVREMQEQTAICAEHALYRELGVPYCRSN